MKVLIYFGPMFSWLLERVGLPVGGHGRTSWCGCRR